MSQDVVLLLVRGLGFVVAIVLIGIAFRFIMQQIVSKTDGETNATANLSNDDNGAPPLATAELAQDEVKQKTSRLNPSFFGGIHKEHPQAETSAQTNNENRDEPVMNLPLTIMARHGRVFSGTQVEELFATFGLKRSPKDAYELMAEDGKKVLFTALNVRKPGVFPTDFSNLDKIEGLLLILQLPVDNDPLKSLETFLAVASEMADSIDGRLCDHSRRPMGEKDVVKYRLAAEQFDTQYNEWLAKQRR